MKLIKIRTTPSTSAKTIETNFLVQLIDSNTLLYFEHQAEKKVSIIAKIEEPIIVGRTTITGKNGKRYCISYERCKLNLNDKLLEDEYLPATHNLFDNIFKVISREEQ